MSANHAHYEGRCAFCTAPHVGDSGDIDVLDEDAILAACREAVEDATQVLLVAFRRYCVDRWGVPPTEDDFRSILATQISITGDEHHDAH